MKLEFYLDIDRCLVQLDKKLAFNGIAYSIKSLGRDKSNWFSSGKFELTVNELHIELVLNLAKEIQAQ